MAPLFLIAAFSTVLVAKDGYRRLIILYGGLSILMAIAFVVVFQHYLVGIFDSIMPDTGEPIAGVIAKLVSCLKTNTHL